MVSIDNNNCSNVYQNKWESRASIRTRPRKIIDFNLSGYFFPVDKQVLLLLPEVIALGEAVKVKVLLLSFYKYLNDIIHLELKSISSACNNIIHDDMIVSYSEATKLSAYTVIIDEHYHVYTAYDMLIQLRHHYPQIVSFKYPESDSYNAIIQLKNKLEKKYHDIFEIIAVCIFETTLVRELIQYFDSPDIHPSIKHYINDHMNDESRHYNFFYQVLCDTWQQLPASYQQIIGGHLVEFITLYLNVTSEKQFNLSLLIEIGLAPEKAEQMVENLYHGFVVSSEIPMVKQVLTVLKKAGILDNPCIKRQFQEQSLWVID